jgi:2'-5' RNA ligase
MRLFIGIPLNEGLRGYLQECLAVAHDRPLKIRPSPPANWHLTLAYLDEVTDDKMSTLTALLNDCAKKPPRGAFLIDRFETFPRKKPIRLAAHVTPADMASWRRFVIQVRDYASIVASNIDRKPWQPHISIGKAPKRTILPAWSKSITEYAWVPDVFQLVRSNLTADGSVYETIAEYKLEL